MKTLEQQIATLIDESKNILIAPPQDINGDALGGTLALASALEKRGKNIHFLVPKKLPEKFKLFSLEKSLSYDTFMKRDFVLSFDLVLTVNNQNFNNLNKVPLINIDNSLAEKNSGELNLIDPVSSSVSEIIIRLIESIDKDLFDEDVSTFSLAGIIDATNNFQSRKTNQKTFTTAALLIDRGGDQQKIIRHFYKNKSLEFFQLWGKILPNLLLEEQSQLLYGAINQQDFNSTETNPEYIPQVFEEMRKMFPKVKTIVLLWQHSKIEGEIFSKNPETLVNMNRKLKGLLRKNTLLFSIDEKNLNKAKNQLVKLIKDEL